MAQQITRLLPLRDIPEKEIINDFSYNASSGEAGTFVKVIAMNLSEDPVQYTASSHFVNTMGNATSEYPEVVYKVGPTDGTGDAGKVLGMMLRDVREVDENGEKLLFYPRKKEELQCLLSGEAVPIAKRGIVDITARGLAGGVCPNINDAAVLSSNGKVTGVAFSALTTEQRNAVVGKFVGTGIRVSQKTTDAFAGIYAKLVFSIN